MAKITRIIILVIAVIIFLYRRPKRGDQAKRWAARPRDSELWMNTRIECSAATKKNLLWLLYLSILPALVLFGLIYSYCTAGITSDWEHELRRAAPYLLYLALFSLPLAAWALRRKNFRLTVIGDRITHTNIFGRERRFTLDDILYFSYFSLTFPLRRKVYFLTIHLTNKKTIPMTSGDENAHELAAFLCRLQTGTPER